MVGIKLLLLSIFLFFQGIRGYCIYNKLTDGTSFRITQKNYNEGIPVTRIYSLYSHFSKHMEKDTTECCPYTSKDCSSNLRNDNFALFAIELFFTNQPSFDGHVGCETGGGLTIHGTKEKYYVECMNAEGVTVAAPIWNFGGKSS
ncbi:hypothetical protein EDC94DRAFT_647980 [Helicostylum pulchrum]|nr:hypothetical protein EDC94DRAFT_647980 [Helicostylum pulchrum]